MVGYPREHLVGMKSLRLMDEAHAQRFQAILDRALATGQPCRISDWEIMKSDDTSVGVEMSLVPVRNADGSTTGFRGTCRDISQRKLQEELLVQSERLKAIADLSAGVSHNFNNVLQIVLGGTELALSNMETGNFSEARTNVEDVRRSSEVGTETVKRLQDFAKWSHHEKVEEGIVFSLSQTVEQALEMTEPLWKSDPEKRGITISQERRLDQSCLIRGMKHELFDVVVNLIKNAVEALPSGGQITVKTFAMQDEKAILEVTDTGVGIPRGNLGHLFEPFWTSKGFDGTGMGLAAAYGIVRRHGGEITVESEEGQGTTVAVRLPCAKVPPPAPVHTPMSHSDARLRILVVDDQEPIVDLLHKAFDRLGQTVITALSGLTAVDLFKKEPTDVVICDLGMPLMNGWEVGKAITEWCWEKGVPKPRFIILTGWADQAADCERLKECGVDAVTEKPVDVKRLLEIVMDRHDS